VHDLREIVNAILYVCRTGVAWAYLPHDFPPYQTVYDYYAKWEVDGTTEALHALLRERVRIAKGRAVTPTAAIIDSQSVKTSCNVSESSQGIDAGKKIKGRKRHVVTDVLGLLLAVIVTAASVQDSTAGQQILDRIAVEHSSVSMAWVDGDYNNAVVCYPPWRMGGVEGVAGVGLGERRCSRGRRIVHYGVVKDRVELRGLGCGLVHLGVG
jgi:transposase